MHRLRYHGNNALFGGGLYSRGGAPNAPVVLRESEFEANLAGDGGGLYLIGWYDIVGCTFVGNSAVSGGGILSAEQANVRVVNSGFFGNSADWGGGGLLVAESTFEGRSVQVVNSVFSGNSAMIGGAILSYQLGSDILVEIIHSTFFGNVATGVLADHGGGGIHHNGSAADFRVRNSILWNNSALMGEDDIHVSDAGRLPSLQGTIAATIVGDAPSDMNNLGGTIVADPLFRDPSGQDGIAGTPDDNLELTSQSPALNSGDLLNLPEDWADLDGDGDYTERLPADFASNRRVWPGSNGPAAPDLGAYEFEAPLATDLRVHSPVFPAEVEVSLYPIPFSDFFKVSTPPGWQEPEITVFDVLGRRVSHLLPQSFSGVRTVQTAQLPPGLYLIRIGATGRRPVWIAAPRI
jgi:Secretion system C-terminal sorting domain